MQKQEKSQDGQPYEGEDFKGHFPTVCMSSMCFRYYDNILDLNGTFFHSQESEILDAQNRSLKVEINKLEAEKSRLLSLLSQHEPTCERKLKDIMKTKQKHVVYETYQNASPLLDGEFRVPLPPVRINPQPPTFAEAIRMASEVVKEEEEELPMFNDDGMGSYENFYHQTDNHFLAKRTLGQTYLDLDSRCIAL